MKRREFIQKGALVIGMGQSLLSSCTKAADINPEELSLADYETDNYTDKLRFGICADVHQDAMFGMPERLQEFIHEMNRQKVDFIIQLGDFCFPRAENRPFLNIWNAYDGPKYHVLGNHDMDHNSKDDFIRFAGMPGAYYSFDRGGYHFIVLDVNNGKAGNEIIPYNSGNQNDGTLVELNYLDDRQLRWLEEDLNATNKRTVIFSHQPVYNNLRNKDEFDDIIDRINGDAKKVFVAFSGHQHLNWMRFERGVQHIQINSMAYNWPGSGYTDETRYSPEIYQRYPLMRNMWPYSSSLYGIVELDPVERRLRLIGKESSWVPPTPEEMGAGSNLNRAAKIDSRSFTY